MGQMGLILLVVELVCEKKNSYRLTHGTDLSGIDLTVLHLMVITVFIILISLTPNLFNVISMYL